MDGVGVHNNPIFKIGIDDACQHFNLRHILGNMIELTGSFANFDTETLRAEEGPGTLLNQITLSNSSTEKSLPMQAVKKPVSGGALNTEIFSNQFRSDIFVCCLHKSRK